MQEIIKLDEVTAFGGKLSFLIPSKWEEQPEDKQTYLYCLPAANSGWFRVSLNSVRTQTPAETLEEIVRETEAARHQKTGNWVWTRERTTEEDGVKIHIYYWFVANITEPDYVREAIFSYTILSERSNDAETKSTLQLIEQIVGRASFNPNIYQ